MQGMGSRLWEGWAGQGTASLDGFWARLDWPFLPSASSWCCLGFTEDCLSEDLSCSHNPSKTSDTWVTCHPCPSVLRTYPCCQEPSSISSSLSVEICQIKQHCQTAKIATQKQDIVDTLCPSELDKIQLER